MSSPLVIVPVLNRPHRVQALVDSFDEGLSEGELLFVVNDSDELERDALIDAQAQYVVVDDEILSWPCKIDWVWKNHLLPEWSLLAADDVKFYPAWWQNTALIRNNDFIKVIGTNDLGNPSVIAGQHSCHPLVRRDFVGLDGDGPVHTGYRHWFVDNELVATASATGSWAFCATSVVEHLHPYWGKGKMDNTYTLGESESFADSLLWEKRLPMIEELANVSRLS